MPEHRMADKISAEADKIAKSLSFGRFVMTVLAFVVATVSWIPGRLWFLTAKMFIFIGLSLKYGWIKGAKVPTEKKQARQ